MAVNHLTSINCAEFDASDAVCLFLADIEASYRFFPLPGRRRRRRRNKKQETREGGISPAPLPLAPDWKNRSIQDSLP